MWPYNVVARVVQALTKVQFHASLHRSPHTACSNARAFSSISSCSPATVERDSISNGCHGRVLQQAARQDHC